MSPLHKLPLRPIPQRLWLVLAALVLLTSGGFVLYAAFSAEEQGCTGWEHPEQIEVLWVARPIPAGTTLTPKHVIKILVPFSFLPPDPVYSEDLEVYMGMPVSVHIKESRMMRASDVDRVDQVVATLAISAREGGRMGEAWSLVWYVTWR